MSSIETGQPPPGKTPDEPARRDHIRELTIRIDSLQAELEGLEDLTVKGYRGGRHGGVASVRYVKSRVRALQELIDTERATGSRKHNTVSPWLRALVLLPLVTDFVIVVLFFSVVFNVALSAPGDTPAELTAALIFATIITVGLALALRWIGLHRRADKNDEAQYDPSEGTRPWVPRLEMALLVVLLIGVAAVMLVRVVSDAADAGVELGAGWAVALFLAVVTAALNWIIYLVEFADGSEETHEQDHWGKQLRPVQRKERDLKAKIRAAKRQLRLAGVAEEPTAPPAAPGPAKPFTPPSSVDLTSNGSSPRSATVPDQPAGSP